jgi:hypothetical protein
MRYWLVIIEGGPFFRKGWEKALSEGDAVGQAHKRIALLRFACL